MKRTIAALLLMMVAVMAGCGEGPHVDKGGGETAVLEVNNGRPTGRVDVLGHVVNSGGSKARDVELTFQFFQDGVLYLEGKLLIGDVSSGTSKSFGGAFFGPPVTGAFSWDYRIDWD